MLSRACSNRLQSKLQIFNSSCFLSRSVMFKYLHYWQRRDYPYYLPLRYLGASKYPYYWQRRDRHIGYLKIWVILLYLDTAIWVSAKEHQVRTLEPCLHFVKIIVMFKSFRNWQTPKELVTFSIKVSCINLHGSLTYLHI